MNGASISATPWLGGFGCAGRLIGAGCEAGIDHGSRAAKRPIKISNEDRVQTYRANSFQRAALSQAPAGPISLGLSAACQGLQGEVEGGGGDGGQAAGVQVGYAAVCFWASCSARCLIVSSIFRSITREPGSMIG